MFLGLPKDFAGLSLLILSDWGVELSSGLEYSEIISKMPSTGVLWVTGVLGDPRSELEFEVSAGLPFLIDITPVPPAVGGWELALPSLSLSSLAFSCAALGFRVGVGVGLVFVAAGEEFTGGLK